MRGIGSGRRGQWPIIEHGLKLDLRSLRRQGLFEPKGNCQFISLRWTSNATGETTSTAQFSYSTRPDGKWLRLQYAVTRYSDGERINVDETFRLEAFSQPFGGIRWYVICPDRQVRCQCLYLPPGATHFRSRQGFRARLQYYSQTQPPHLRVFERGRSIAARVLKAGPPDWQEKYRDWDFPPKPPWMRWKTYNRQFALWEHYEAQGEAYLSSWMARLGNL